jgi:LPS export ABC transporter protein LptC
MNNTLIRCGNSWFVTVLFCLSLISFCSCKSDTQQAIAPPGEVPDQQGWNSKMTATINGRVSAIIEYGHMERFANQRTVRFDGGINVDFYNAEGVHSSNVKSKRGILYEPNNDVEALDNVIVVSDSGMTLRSERLKWEQQRQRIVTNEFVVITTAERDTLWGHGFESDQALKNWSILHPTGVTEKKLALDVLEDEKKPSADENAPALNSAPPADTVGKKS